MVRAKFYVESISKHKGFSQGPLTSIKMFPVSPTYKDNKLVENENSKFWSASPSGSLQLDVVNPAAVEHFEVGAEYYVDFTPA